MLRVQNNRNSKAGEPTKKGHVMKYASTLIILAALLPLLNSCASGSGKSAKAAPLEEVLLFPLQPTKPRIQFLTYVNGAADVEPGKGAFADFVLGGDSNAKRRIDKPFGVAARDGVIYVCDTKALNITKLDFKNQKFSTFGDSGPGRLKKPINILIDARGFKFVADPIRNQVVVFDPVDKFVTAFEIPKPCRIVDIALWGEELYVLDNDETCQIVVLDRTTGKFLRAFGGPGREPGQFSAPNSICFGPKGYLHVSDTHAHRIQKLDREGNALWVVGEPGYHLGQFGRPRGLRVAPDGVVYVVDAATEIIQMFNSEGKTLMYFGGPGNVPGAMFLPSQLAIDTTSIPYFKKYIHPDFKTDYLLITANQYGSFLISIYAFGSFPEGYEFKESEVTTIPRIEADPSKDPLGVPMDSHEK